MDLSTLCFEHSPVCVGIEPQLAPYLPGIWLLEVAGERYQGVVKVKVGPVTVVIFSMSVSVAHVSARVSGTSNSSFKFTCSPPSRPGSTAVASRGIPRDRFRGECWTRCGSERIFWLSARMPWCSSRTRTGPPEEAEISVCVPAHGSRARVACGGAPGPVGELGLYDRLEPASHTPR